MICQYEPLAPFPLEEDATRLFAGQAEQQPCSSRHLCLDIAEAIVDQLVDSVDQKGILVDVVEGHDNRWQGGTASRFACPAAVLVQERGRNDLLEPASRALTQVAGGILRAAANGEDFLPGVIDLSLKEFFVAWLLLRDRVDDDVAAVWHQALVDVHPDTAYTGPRKLRNGTRCSNYEVSACTAEWLRTRYGMADTRQWIDRYLAYNLPYLTEFGMYRDPHDPMLYDMMVRQNLSELMHYGYNGQHHERIEELLRRAGLTTLLMLSPCGWTPFGGRSNLLLHNEAMAAFICEHQANCCHARGQSQLAGAFKEAAHRAALAVQPYACASPFRFVKNRFAPQGRHGKDSGYGEYSNYGALAASLFARAALLANDDIPATRFPPARRGSVVNLWPAFHKTFATCGELHVEIDTRSQDAYDATGLGRFHRAGAPPELALAMNLPCKPKYVVEEASTDRAVALGPCWQRSDGQWDSLAGMSMHTEDVVYTRLKTAEDDVSWCLEWKFQSWSDGPQPVTGVTQLYRLTRDRLEIQVSVAGVYRQLGFEVPCFVTAGEQEAELDLDTNSATVSFQDWTFAVEVPGAESSVFENALRGNRAALYRVARFDVPRADVKVVLRLCPSAGEG